ncbi:hypothetical protein JZ751_013393 [Albula glossodonta]|uniref:Uncharacterized protein n=1 Tax=Albula glossodonta TaxID=121402 RepID=A0A8T2MJY5_9TELE|nr:hypothetical protein JZ751_013393 [Albula glossodonta]
MEQCVPPTDVKRTKPKPPKPSHPPPKPPQTLQTSNLKPVTEVNGNLIHTERMDRSVPILPPRPRPEEFNNTGFNLNERTKINICTQAFNMNMQENNNDAGKKMPMQNEHPSDLEKQENPKGEEEEKAAGTAKAVDKSQGSGILKENEEKAETHQVYSADSQGIGPIRGQRGSEGELENRQPQDKGVFGNFWKNSTERTPTFTSYIMDANPEGERTIPGIEKENESAHDELSASNDSLSDIDKKEKGGMFSGMFRKTPKPSGGPTPAQDNLSTHSELSASNDSLSDNNTKEKGGILSGMFRRAPKPAENSPTAQENESIHSKLSASNDSPLISTKRRKEGSSLAIPKIPKPAEDTAPVQVTILTLYSPLPAQVTT